MLLGNRIRMVAMATGCWGWIVAGMAGAQALRGIDINQEAAGSNPAEFIVKDGAAYFTASTPELGRELWRSDGTEQGTYVLSDVSTRLVDLGAHSVVQVGDEVCFAADHGAASTLWCSDGTPVGTVPITAPGAVTASLFNDGAALDGRWYFNSGQSGGTGLWQTDGTAAGTTLVVPGSLGFDIVRVGDRLAFAMHTDAEGFELWLSDGTVAGTHRVADIHEGPFGANPIALTPAGSRLYFLADDGVHGRELWVSDGTALGTRLVVDLAPGGGSSIFVEMVAIGDALYFTDRQRLWRTEGVGATLVVDVGADEIRSMLAVGTSLYIVSGNRLLRANDTTGLLTLVRAFGDVPLLATAWDDRLVFTATDDGFGDQLWTTNGSASGTVPITAFVPDDHATVDRVTAGQQQLWLSVRDRLHGSELWVNEGTPASNRLVRDLNDIGTQGSAPAGMTWLGDRWVFFAATPDHGFEPWASDGTEAGTRLIRDIAPGPERGVQSPTQARLGNRMIFGASDGQLGIEPWVTDGTAAGTHLIRDIHMGESSSHPSFLTAAGPYAYFTADDGVIGSELWRTDGSQVGTILLADLEPGPADQSLDEMVAAGDGVFLLAGAYNNRTLWMSKGSPSETTSLLTGLAETWLLPFGGGVVFQVHDGATELWFSDGSTAGTQVLLPVPGTAGHIRQKPVVLNDHMVFILENLGTLELWSSDGSAAGTQRLTDLPGSTAGSIFEFAQRVGQHVYFGQDLRPGCALWVTDGTSDGTRLVRELGSRSCFLTSDIDVAARYGFTYSAFGSDLREQLWTSDGSYEGTHALGEVWLHPGAQLSSNGRAVVFAGDDGIHGSELWFLDDPCLVQSEPLWLHDGRFKAEACWRVEPDREGASGPLPITDTTGGLFFFNPANLDLALKIHDGRPANGKFWFFLAGLTNVAADVRVVDMHTGRARDFALPGGSFESTGSIDGFPDLPPDAPEPPSSSTVTETVETLPRKGVATCDDGAALCLNQDRFRVSVAWHTGDQQGEGQPVPLTDNSGTFWFFRPENVELFVKIHDGRPNNGHFWVFLGALSNVGYTVTVTDIQTGATRSYVNQPGTLRSFGDTLAFPG